VITPAEITAIIKTPVGAGVYRDQGGDVTTCTFKTADGATIVNVLKYERANDMLKNIRTADKNAKAVAGVGDEAVIQVAIGTITLQIGEIGIAVNASPPPSEEALVALGKAAEL
jgi:hypothetical protein